MNKDMINIDDFVREKLGEQEERRDPAAWLKMKDLLDKEMPERAVPMGFRLRKPLAFIGAALLLALLSVGGYKMMTLKNNNQNIDTVNINKEQLSNAKRIQKVAAANTLNNSNDNRDENGSSINDMANEQITPATTTTHLKQKRNSSALAVSNTISKSSNQGQFSNSAEAQQRNNHSSINKSAQNTFNKQNVARINEQGDQANGNSSRKNQPLSLNQNKVKLPNKIQTSNNHTNNSIAITAPDNTTTTKENKKPRPLFASSNNTNSGNNTIKTKVDKSNKAKHSVTLDNKTNAKNNVVAKNKTIDKPATTTAKQTLDSIKTLTVVERTETNKSVPRKTIYKTDTVSIGKTAIVKNEQSKTLAEETTAATSTRKQRRSTLRKIAAENKKAAILAAANNTTKTEPNLAAAKKNNNSNSESVTTSINKKKQKRNSLSFISADKVNEVVNNVKYDIGHALFYFGATAGGNYSLSKTNSFTGMQLGLTGEIVFNKHLSLMGELKYFNRSGNRKTVNDDYTNVTVNKDSTVGVNNYFTMITDSTHHYYNFSTLHSFELPITLRYAINKFYLMTGINLAYYLTVNAEEVSTYYPASSTRSSGGIQSSIPLYTTMTKQLDIQDFNSKFGIGYIFGLGYQITPAFQVDLRITKTFWDNSGTDGGKHLSKDFYQIPSVQLSIGYQFNKGKSKPTFGPTSTP